MTKQSSETVERFWITSSLSLLVMTNDAAIAPHLARFRTPNLICPSCQLAAPLPACRAVAKHLTFAAIPRPQGGAYRDRHERKDAGQRWTRGERERRTRLL